MGLGLLLGRVGPLVTLTGAAKDATGSISQGPTIDTVSLWDFLSPSLTARPSSHWHFLNSLPSIGLRASLTAVSLFKAPVGYLKIALI